MSKYFFVQLPVFGQWGPKTETDKDCVGRVTKLHYLLDVIPTSELSKTSPYLIVMEGLRQHLSECSGVVINEGLFEGSDILQELHPSVKIPRMFWAEVTGTAHEHDFGLERGAHLIASQKAKGIIENRPHEGVTFTEGSPPSDEDIKRKLFDDARKFADEIKAKDRLRGNR